jgi:hypothetical protein
MYSDSSSTGSLTVLLSLAASIVCEGTTEDALLMTSTQPFGSDPSCVPLNLTVYQYVMT